MSKYFVVKSGQTLNPLQSHGEIVLVREDGTAWSPDSPADIAARPSTLASYVPLSRAYDPSTQVYNLRPAHLRRARAKAAAARAGLDRFKIMTVGDSNTRGVGALKASTSYPALLKGRLVGAGIPNGGTGLVFPEADGRWTLGGGFNRHAATKFTYYTSTAGPTATFVSDVPGTIVDYYYRGTTAAHTVTIDGGAPINIPNPGGASDIRKHTVTGLANTTHTIVVTATNSFTYMFGVDVHSGTGVAVCNAGISGTTSADWAVTDFDGPRPVSSAWAPDLTVLILGANDVTTGISVAAFEANMAALIASYKALGDTVIGVPIPRGNAESDSLFPPYVEAIYRLAEAQDVPLIDLSARWGTAAQATTLGMMSDTLHGSATGYGDIAGAVFSGLGLGA